MIEVLCTIGGREMYKFLDGSVATNKSGYLKKTKKTCFVLEWGIFVAIVMMLGLRTTWLTFQ